jgi:hypothetical protein
VAAQHISGILMPIIRSLSTAVAASGLPLERGGSSDVGRGRSGPDGPRPTTLLPPRSNGKPETATAVNKLLMMCMRMPEDGNRIRTETCRVCNDAFAKHFNKF